MLGYDFEVFAYDWVVVFIDDKTEETVCFHNDNAGVRNFVKENELYIGFNTKSYDQYIMKGVCLGFTPEQLKRLNDYLIEGNQGWQYPDFKGEFFRFNNVDIRDDMQMTLSLKSIEGHLGLPIVESSVPFDIDRALTDEEVAEVIDYCTYDVKSTLKIVKLRRPYLLTKLNLGRRTGLSAPESLACTNAKLTAKMLKAVKHEYTDGREYVYPPNLDLSKIPQDVLDFFETIHDYDIPDEELFKTSLETTVGGLLCKFAWGGVHGSVTAYHTKRTKKRRIQNRDVSSLYPSLIVLYNYLSRNVPDKSLFVNIRDERLQAKHDGNKQLAKDLKLPLNTVSGAQENKYNDLYDPLPTRSLRISGQLFLTMLVTMLVESCKSITLLNLNTDGIMYEIDEDEVTIADEICAEWERITKFELELDEIEEVWIKDVNNLLIVKEGGTVKKVGSYVNWGVSEKGAFGINNSAIIAKKALIEYFINGTPVEDTVNNATDIFDFQFIAKGGSKYKAVVHEVDGESITVQNCNRVYATKDERFGTLYKIKRADDSIAKIENLPEHCVIDNENKLTVDDIDKQFYIDLANRKINDYKGVKNMATSTTTKKTSTKATEKKEDFGSLTIYQKLAIARTKLLSSGVSKSGKNPQLQYKYFELDDIVPAIMPIFNELGLLSIVSFDKEYATLTITDTLKGTEAYIVFKLPLVINEGNRAVSEVQALGASVTYYRRYLYMMALDICEPDEIDSTVPTPKVTEPVKTPASKPLTEVERKEVANVIANADGSATDLQIKQLKKVLKELRESGDFDEYITKIVTDTKEFKALTKADCERLIGEVQTKMKGE